MANKVLDGLRSSEILRIEAAVMEIMENAGFNPQVTVDLRQTNNENEWSMNFNKKEITLDELEAIKKELGEKFSILLAAKDKTTIDIRIEGPKEVFKQLLDRKIGMRKPEQVPLTHMGNGTINPDLDLQ